MFKIQFNLKQHTPLIHFHNQHNATVRATEIKPKLDKYLVKTMGGKEASQIYDKWKISNVKDISFDYKATIETSDVVNVLIPEGAANRIPFYFGNMGAAYAAEPKYLSFTEMPLQITITTFNNYEVNNETLLEFIKSVIGAFFLQENFGTRQSKGYGSFYIHPSDQLYESPATRIDFQNEDGYYFLPYSFEISVKGQNQYEQAMDLQKGVEVFYKAMRSGINVCYGREKHYLKSLLWLYFKKRIEPNLKWEKKKIKEEFLSGNKDIARQITDHSSTPEFKNSPLGFNGTNELLIKDLFGLASDEIWSAKYHDFKIQKVIQDIDRYKSPVLFKPIRITDKKFVVYFQAAEINAGNSILQKTVEIKKSLSINTPANFDFHDFFNFLSNPSFFKLDENMLVQAINKETDDYEFMKVSDIKGQGTNEHSRIENYKILTTIISQLQNK